MSLQALAPTLSQMKRGEMDEDGTLIRRAKVGPFKYTSNIV
jgi:hypothetical protein